MENRVWIAGLANAKAFPSADRLAHWRSQLPDLFQLWSDRTWRKMEFSGQFRDLCLLNTSWRNAGSSRTHTNGIDPIDHGYISIDIPDGISLEYVSRNRVKGWKSASCFESRQFGDQWFREKRSCILIVPSAVCPAPAFNIVINTEHPDFKDISCSRAKKLRWDRRLFQ